MALLFSLDRPGRRPSHHLLSWNLDGPFKQHLATDIKFCNQERTSTLLCPNIEPSVYRILSVLTLLLHKIRTLSSEFKNSYLAYSLLTIHRDCPRPEGQEIWEHLLPSTLRSPWAPAHSLPPLHLGRLTCGLRRGEVKDPQRSFLICDAICFHRFPPFLTWFLHSIKANNKKFPFLFAHLLHHQIRMHRKRSSQQYNLLSFPDVNWLFNKCHLTCSPLPNLKK